MPSKFLSLNWKKYLPQMLAASVMLISLAVTGVLWWTFTLDAENELKAEFDFRVRDTVDSIEERMKVYAQVLRGTRGWVSSMDGFGRNKFEAYVDSLQIYKTYPGIDAIGIALIVPQEARSAHVSSMRRQGYKDFRMWPGGQRPVVTSVVQLEPFSERNRRAFGYDMFSEPVRRNAMERARDTNDIAISGKVTLVHEDEETVQAGFLMYLPFYRNGAPPGKLDERRSAIAGWVYMPFRMGDLMENIGGVRASELDIEIFDGEDVSAETLMFDSDKILSGTRPDLPYLKAERRIHVGGHAWTVVVHSQPGMLLGGYNSSKPAIIAVVGVLLGALLALLTYLLASGRARALAMATEMTREMKESAELMRFVIEGAGDGIWDWNVQTGKVHFSPRWKQMLGYAEEEVGDDLEDWKMRVHPDDMPRVMADLDAYLQGASPSYRNEHRLLCKDGSWKWILVRGMVVSRTDDGKPLRLVGTHTDIAERKNAEQRQVMLKSLYGALSAINEVIVHERSESLLFEHLCRITVEYGGMPLAWVGFPETDGRFMPIASSGKAKGYMDGWFVRIASAPEGSGSAVSANPKKGRLVIDDMHKHTPVEPWQARAAEYGLKAAAAFPIMRMGQPYAVLAVYSEQAGAFSEEVVLLIERMADNISFALDNLDSEVARIQREEEIRVLFDNASDGIFILNQSGRFVDVSERGAQLLGYGKEELRSLPVADIVAEQERRRVRIEMSTLTESPRLSEWVIRRKDGSEMIGEVSAQLLPDGRSVGFVRDVTERKRAEERLKLAALVFQNAAEAMTVTDAAGNIVAVNPAFTQLTGYEADEVVGKNPRILKSGRHDSKFYDAMWRSIRTTGSWQGEIWNRRKDGEVYIERLGISTVFNDDGSVQCYVAMFRDVSKEKETEEMIRALSANHIEVREQEGKRIAREIHDDLGQRLTLLRMDVLMLPKTIGENGVGLPEAVARMRGSIDDCIRIARNIVAELRPAVLDIGIIPAIEWLVDDFEKRTGIACFFNDMIEGETVLNEQQATGVFRILQESLTNVAKHAWATRIEVDLEVADGHFCLTISDNGIGISPDLQIGTSSYGLIGMRERAAMLGGRLNISGQQGKGTVLILDFPMHDSLNHQLN